MEVMGLRHGMWGRGVGRKICERESRREEGIIQRGIGVFITGSEVGGRKMCEVESDTELRNWNGYFTLFFFATSDTVPDLFETKSNKDTTTTLELKASMCISHGHHMTYNNLTHTYTHTTVDTHLRNSLWS